MKLSRFFFPKQIAIIHFRHIANVVGDAVGNDHIGLLLELHQVVQHSGAEKGWFTTSALPPDGTTALLTKAAGCQVIGRLNDGGDDEVFAGGVGFDDGVDKVLRDFAVVGEELFGVFGQTVATVAKAGVVVVVADAGIKVQRARLKVQGSRGKGQGARGKGQGARGKQSFAFLFYCMFELQNSEVQFD